MNFKKSKYDLRNRPSGESKKALHCYATGGASNSGDFILGPSTKWHFENNIIKEKVRWFNANVRSQLPEAHVKFINDEFDYLVVGGGGLMLPDTNPNNLSCWQWPVTSQAFRGIKVPIYVISMGYNLFHGQKVTMPRRDSNVEDPKRYDIFKDNMETLIDVSEHFSLRHNGDCDRLKEIVDPKYHDKIKFLLCPSIDFSKHYVAENGLTPSPDRDIYAFEIKDDRQARRYYKTSIQVFYDGLKKYILHLQSLNKNVYVLSHDGSGSFKRYLEQNGVKVGFMSNSNSNEKNIMTNYLKIDKLFCTAGHSQMMGHALGCDIISLITHDKIRYYLEDVGLYEKNRHVDVNSENVYDKLMQITQ
jgi:hypothetical protein